MTSIEAKRLAQRIARIEREQANQGKPQLAYSSIENGNLKSYEGNDLKMVVGLQDDGGQTTTVFNGPTPPTPANYTVTVDHGSLTVHWDGDFEDGAVAPSDWARWTAYAQEGATVVPSRTTAIGGTDSASGGEVTAGVLKGQWTVTVLAWSQAGKPSAMGLPVTVDVPGYGDIVLAEIDAAETDIKNAGEILVTEQDTLNDKLDDAFGQIEDAIVSANGKNTVHYEDRPPTPSDPGIFDDTWFVGQVGRPNDIIEATNMCPNPSFELAVDQAGWGSRADESANIEVSPEWSESGSNSLKATGNDGYVASSSYYLIDRTASVLLPGKTYTVSATARLSAPMAGALHADSRSIVFGTRNATSGAFTYTVSKSTPLPNVAGAARLSHTFTVPVGFYGFIRLMNGSFTSSIWWDAVDVAEVVAARPYFDGDTPDGATDNESHYRWTGTPHASTSEKYLPALGANTNWNVVAQYRHDGTGWVEVELSHHVISSADVGKLVAGSATIKEAVVQKLWAEVVVAKMVVADEFIGENAILTGAVTAPKITASEELWAKIGEFVQIRAEQIKADAIDGMVVTGATIRTSGGSGSWSDAGLFIAQPDGTSMVRFPTDGSPLSLTASDVQIDRAAIGDLDLSNGAVRSGGQVTLAAGVTAPASPPGLTTGWQKVCTLPKPEAVDPGDRLQSDWLGLGYWAAGSGHWVRALNVLGAAGDTYDEIDVYSVDGVFEKAIKTGLNPRHGVTVIGDIAYVMGPDYEQANIGKQWVHGFDLNTGARVTRWEFTDFAGGKNKIALGTDGTNLVVAGANLNISRRLHIVTLNPSTGVRVGDPFATDEWVSYTKDVEAVHISGNSMWVSHVEAVREFSLSGSTPTYTNSGWVNPDKNGDGVAFRGAIPYVVDGVGNVYQGSRFASDSTFEVMFTWYDGTHETTPSPVGTIAVPARQGFTVSLPTRAGMQKHLYYRQGTSGNYMREPLSESATSKTVYNPPPFYVFVPPATNTFPNADPATLKSTNDKFVVHGDGSGSWGPLTFNADGTADGLVKAATGTVTIGSTVAADGGKWSTVITFPPGRFTTPPAVSHISENGRLVASIEPGTLTATSVQINLFNWTSGAGGAGAKVYWTAIKGA